MTNGMKPRIIAMFRRGRRAPCKLNNVTKRKHQKVIPFRWYDQRTEPFCRVESITGGTGKMKLWKIALKMICSGRETRVDTIL